MIKVIKDDNKTEKPLRLWLAFGKSMTYPTHFVASASSSSSEADAIQQFRKNYNQSPQDVILVEY